MAAYIIKPLTWTPCNRADLISETPAGQYAVIAMHDEWFAELDGATERHQIGIFPTREAAVAAADAHWVALLAPFLCQVTE